MIGLKKLGVFVVLLVLLGGGAALLLVKQLAFGLIFGFGVGAAVLWVLRFGAAFLLGKAVGQLAQGSQGNQLRRQIWINWG